MHEKLSLCSPLTSFLIGKENFVSLNNSVVYLRNACDAQTLTSEESFLKSHTQTLQVYSITYCCTGSESPCSLLVKQGFNFCH